VKRYLAVLIIIAGVFASYAPALRDGFVWDDTALILRDPLIRSWRLIPEGFNHFLFVDATASDFYRPLQRLTYTLDYAAFAFRSGPYHAASILWHAAAAIALFVFAEELLLAFGIERQKRLWIAFLAVLVWAIHPVESAAVAYVSGRADPLAATFGSFGLYLFLLSLRAIGQRKLFFLFGAGVALLLSALSKETGLIFLAIGIAFFVLKKNWINMCKAVAVAAFVCAIYFSLRSAAEHIPPPALSGVWRADFVAALSAHGSGRGDSSERLQPGEFKRRGVAGASDPPWNRADCRRHLLDGARAQAQSGGVRVLVVCGDKLFAD
jgi:protein O-mannosyl-transferase